MVDKDVERWTETAKHVYTELRQEGMDSEEAAELTEAVLAEIGRDRRTEQIGEQRRGFPQPGEEEDREEWRSKPVSDKQRDILKDHGYGDEELEDMTRGEASDQLDEILGEE
ncbi:MAG: hypothetical protein SVS85_03955 [Candidatus Nanohaloarchaea archaeon]|nr:hypothetical protein [Candidatus Nanohaloarchaea archaeon]